MAAKDWKAGVDISAVAARFRSPWWLGNRHIQTLYRRFAPQPGAPTRRQRIELQDGDFIDLDWCDRQPCRGVELPIVVLLHGLCGSSTSPYIQSLQLHLHGLGYDSVAMNFRGCSGEINRLARAYHSGCSEDLEEVSAALRTLHPGRCFAYTGYSLGGNVLLKWLSGIGVRDDVVGAVAVSTPFSLSRCSHTLNRGLSRVYGQYFRNRLVQDVEAKRALFRRGGNAEQLRRLEALGDLKRLRTLWDFDDQVTAPLHGFAGAQDYYDRCSSGPRLKQILVPLQLIQSVNDPFIPEDALPRQDELSSSVSLLLTTGGGHVGFTCAGECGWLEQRIGEAIGRMTAVFPAFSTLPALSPATLELD